LWRSNGTGKAQDKARATGRRILNVRVAAMSFDHVTHD
jgi:hypothetical protein